MIWEQIYLKATSSSDIDKGLEAAVVAVVELRAEVQRSVAQACVQVLWQSEMNAWADRQKVSQG